MGSKVGTVQIWEVETGRCLRVWEVDEAVKHVSWNPEPDLPILAVCVGQDLLLLKMGIGKAEEQSRMRELLNVEESPQWMTLAADEAVYKASAIFPM
ncbi:hypothetical protein QJS04_geneDACA021898 [Acorus gramineus]|uniref:Uncharacterized protein n=1 Tax=Acorus gramineus TaxID=55184 RepID=A0AAV9B8E4_ACOGR|nr:hypothetical protein QJS04_geneDACA021898 [Acorus gramineus]